MKRKDAEQIQAQLNMAWDAHQLHQETKGGASAIAFERLYNATVMLFNALNRDADPPQWLDQALNEGKGVYKP